MALFSVTTVVPVKVLGLASAFGTGPLGALIGGFPAGGALGMSSAKVGRNANVERAAPNTAGRTQRRNFLYECLWFRDVVFLCVLLFWVFIVISPVRQ